MKKCSLHLIVTAMTVFALLVVMTAPAAAQGRGAQSRKPKPTVGAWWYKGDPQPPGPHPDLTGVWFGGPMNDIGRDVLPGQQLVLTPYGAERYKKIDHAKDPNAQCLPPGPTRMVARAHPTMIVQRPDVVAVLSESEHIFRLIYTDGRSHPSDATDNPAWFGYSVGKWEGDTLVVDTVGINDRTWLDVRNPAWEATRSQDSHKEVDIPRILSGRFSYVRRGKRREHGHSHGGPIAPGSTGPATNTATSCT